MFEASFQELILLFVIGLLVLGPERLPKVATYLGRWVGKARRTASHLRHQLEREIALAELEQRRKPQVPGAKPGSPPGDAGPAAGTAAQTGATQQTAPAPGKATAPAADAGMDDSSPSG